VLGAYHTWIEEFAKHFERVVVICLEKGEYNLPKNVRVLSLGKESGKSRFKYLKNFYKYIWLERDNYDTVFVHMNQEYVLLGWKLWKFLDKKIYLWRNHAKGSISTRFAVFFSKKVFYTSPSSYTARFKKSVQMPVGIDTDFFKPDSTVSRIPNSILFLGRISPVKRVLEFVEWFNKLDQRFVATIVGEALSKDKYYEKKARALASERIKFIGPVTQEEALRLYQSHEIYVNMTKAGSFDKTIFEAAACGTKVLVENKDLKFLESKSDKDLRDIVVKNHDLKTLVMELKEKMS
jgi:glycosyltransferase involved in cell wall biosynthesis